MMQTTALNGAAASSGGFFPALFTFIHTIAHQIGVGMLKLLGTVFASTRFPADLADPLGYLAVLTLFAVLLTLAKKIAWIVLAVGWGFIIIRLLMIIFKI